MNTNGVGTGGLTVMIDWTVERTVAVGVGKDKQLQAEEIAERGSWLMLILLVVLVLLCFLIGGIGEHAASL